MSAEEESLYHIANEPSLFAIADRVYGILEQSRVSRTVAEQVRGDDFPTIVEGGHTPKSTADYYCDWHGVALTQEQATAVSESENRETRDTAEVAIQTAVRIVSLQRRIFFGNYGFADIPDGLGDSTFHSATWRQARLRASGGQLAVFSDVTLTNTYGRGRSKDIVATQYHTVALHDKGVRQDLTIITGARDNGKDGTKHDVFATMFDVEPSEDDRLLQMVAKDIIGDWPQVKKLISAPAETDDAAGENVRAYILQSKLAKKDWALDPTMATGIMRILWTSARRLRAVKERDLILVNGHKKAAPARLREIGTLLGARMPAQ